MRPARSKRHYNFANFSAVFSVRLTQLKMSVCAQPTTFLRFFVFIFIYFNRKELFYPSWVRVRVRQACHQSAHTRHRRNYAHNINIARGTLPRPCPLRQSLRFSSSARAVLSALFHSTRSTGTMHRCFSFRPGRTFHQANIFQQTQYI